MTEPQPITSVHSATAAATMPAPVEEVSRSYWQMVGRAFFRSIVHRIAVTYVILLAIVAVVVPFLANGRPYTAIVDGKREYPLFKTLTRIDLIILVAGAAALVYFAVVFFTRKRQLITERSRPRRISLLVLLIATVFGSCGILAFKNDYNDLLRREDYKSITPDYDIKDAVFAPISWGYDDSIYPRKESSLFQDPSREHPLGTDASGRDTLSRLLWSARIVFGIGLVAVSISLVIGTIYGALMGYFGGTVDILGSRFLELVDGIPTFFLIITLIAIFGRQIFLIMVIIGLTGWTGNAAFVRAEFFKLRKMDFVQAAISQGLPLRSILFRHMLPNALTPILVNATFGIAGAVATESALSFLNLGVEPPTPSWGSMLNEAGNPAEIFHFYLALAPGIMIFLTVFAYNIIGEGFRDAIDPRLNKIQ